MRRIFIRERTTQDGLTALFGARKPNTRKPLSDLQAFGIVLSFFVGLAALGFAALALLTWLAWNSHEFGPRDLRYLLFVRGSLIERVGVIDAQPGTLVYGGQGRDGNAPGFVRAQYISPVEGKLLLIRFAERCRALGLHANVREPKPPEDVRSASCGRTADDDFPVYIRVSGGKATEVGMSEDLEDGL